VSEGRGLGALPGVLTGGVQDVRSRFSAALEQLGVELSGMARAMVEAMMMLESRWCTVGCAKERTSSPVTAGGRAVEQGDGEKHGRRRLASADARNRTSRSVVALPSEAGGAHQAGMLCAVKRTANPLYDGAWPAQRTPFQLQSRSIVAALGRASRRWGPGHRGLPPRAHQTNVP